MNIKNLISKLEQLGVCLTVVDGRIRCKAPKEAMTAQVQHSIRDNKQAIIAYLEAQGSQGLYHALAEQIAKTPDDVALMSADGQTLSYQQLALKIDALTRLVQKHGIQAGDCVAIALPVGIELVACVLAVARCDAVVLPLGQDFPPSFKSQLLSRYDAKIQIDEDSVSVLNNTSSKAADDFIITDLQTGQTLSQQQLLRRLGHIRANISQQPLRVLAGADISRNKAWLELFLPLVSGGCVLLDPDYHMLSSTQTTSFNTLVMDDSDGVLLDNQWHQAIENMAPSLTCYLSISDHPQAYLPTAVKNNPDTQLLRLCQLPGLTEEIGVYGDITAKDGSSQAVRVFGDTSMVLSDVNHQPIPAGIVGIVRHSTRPDWSTLWSIRARKLNLQSDANQAEQWQLMSVTDDNKLWRDGQTISLETIQYHLDNFASTCDFCLIIRADKYGCQRVLLVAESGYGDEVEQLLSFLSQQLPAYSIPDSYLLVSKIPYDADGLVDKPSLLKLAVIETPLLERLHQQVSELADVAACVVTRAMIEPKESKLHIQDLYHRWSHLTVPDNKTCQFDEHKIKAQLDDAPLALAVGDKLTIDASQPQHLVAALIQTAANYPDRRVYFTTGRAEQSLVLSYEQLLQQAKALLLKLKSQGLHQGDNVVIYLTDTRRLLLSFWACLLGGITPVIVSVATNFDGKNTHLNKLVNAIASLNAVAILTETDLLPLPHQAIAIDTWSLTSVNTDELILPTINPSDCAFYQLTSGSTGISKCIQISHQGVVHHIHGSRLANGFTADDINLNWLPMDHVVPILTCHLKDVYLGCEQVQLSTAAVLNDPLCWLATIERFAVSHSWSPNFGFKRLSDAIAQNPLRSFDLSSLKCLMNAGEQCTATVIDKVLAQLGGFNASNLRLQPAFGMAEACTCMTYNNQYQIDKGLVYAQAYPSQNQGFVDLGAPIPGVSIRITDDDNQVVPEGVIGHLQIKGHVVTAGYFNNDKANQEAFVGDGWFDSGDQGFIQQGRLMVTGRLSETLVIRGSNYYCYEIEQQIGELDGVTSGDVAAISFADVQSGTEELAIVYAVEQAEVLARQMPLITAIRAHTGQSTGLTPALVIPITPADFPKTTSGKIQRNQLKKDLNNGLFDDTIKAIDLLANNERTIAPWFYQRQWQKKQLGTKKRQSSALTTLILTAANGPNDLAQHLTTALTEAGEKVYVVEMAEQFSQITDTTFTIDPLEPQHYRQLWSELTVLPGRIIHLLADQYFSAFDLPLLQRRQQLGCLSVLTLLQSVAQQQTAAAQALSLLVVTRATLMVSDDDPVQLGFAALNAQLQTAGKEYPWLQWQQLDFATQPAAKVSQLLLAELDGDSCDHTLAFRQSGRLIPQYSAAKMTGHHNEGLIQAGVYLISGALGGIGIELARMLQSQFDARLILLGTKPLAALDEYQHQVLTQLGKTGTVSYIDCDLTQQHSLQTAMMAHFGDDSPLIDGVFHLAGVMSDNPLQQQSQAKWQHSVAVKLYGGWQLSQWLLAQSERRTANASLPLFVHFSSLNAIFGGSGMGAYGGANRELETLAQWQRHSGKIQALCLHWSLWHNLGMSEDFIPSQIELSRAMGYYSLSINEGLHSLLGAIGAGHPNLLIGLDSSKSAIQTHLAYHSERLEVIRVFYQLKDQQQASALAASLQNLTVNNSFGDSLTCQYYPLASLPKDAEALARWHESDGAVTNDMIPPSTEYEQQVYEIWQALLPVQQFSINDSFFALGGNSLLATQAVHRLEQVFDIKLTVHQFFEKPTVAQLAKYFQVIAHVLNDSKQNEDEHAAREVFEL